MSDMTECPVCGKKVPATELQILDNGNAACPDCVRKEPEKQDAGK